MIKWAVINKTLKEKIELLPRASGVYKFLNSSGQILYIGKAHDLKSRVSSYFSSDHKDRPRIIQMIPIITDIKTIITDNDIEALVLESALIKKNKPKFNTLAKDDKSYAYLYINIKNKYPTVKIVRQITPEQTRQGKLFGPYPSGSTIKRVYYYLRRIYPFCTSKDPTKPCFDMHIGLCPGPIPSHEYKKNITKIVNFLSGKSKKHLSVLEAEMREYSKNLEFEKAAKLSDRIEDLKYLTTRVIADNTSSESDYLKAKKEIDLKNINFIAKQLGINQLNRIECYDISNISGKNSYGSMSVGINGQLDQSQYRIFKIKTLNTPNDPSMLAEVLQRRIKHINHDTQDNSLNSKPDLILIDGGVTQLSAVDKVIRNKFYTIGITKGRKYRRKGQKLIDEFHILNKEKVKTLKLKNTKFLSLLRDEAHRFAILHHRKNRSLTQTKSFLDEIKNVGPKTKKILKTNFNNKEILKKASQEELYKLIKNTKIVNSILSYLKEGSKKP